MEILWYFYAMAAISWGGALMVPFIRKKEGKGSAILMSILRIIIMSASIFYAFESGVKSAEIKADGSYYGVLTSTPALTGGRLTQVIDYTDGGKIKTGVLQKYPPKGYVFEQTEKILLLIPEYAQVGETKEGKVIIVSPGMNALIIDDEM